MSSKRDLVTIPAASELSSDGSIGVSRLALAGWWSPMRSVRAIHLSNLIDYRNLLERLAAGWIATHGVLAVNWITGELAKDDGTIWKK